MKRNIKDVAIASFFLIAILLLQMVAFSHHHKIDQKNPSSYKVIAIDSLQNKASCTICELISLGKNFVSPDLDISKYLLLGFFSFAAFIIFLSLKNLSTSYFSRAPPILF